jgi:hypothetical protein
MLRLKSLSQFTLGQAEASRVGGCVYWAQRWSPGDPPVASIMRNSPAHHVISNGVTISK